MRAHWRSKPPSHDCAMRPWLVAKGSLSARIQRRCRAFRVQRVRERYESGSTFAREVVLRADEVPVVVARSTTSPDSLRGPWRAMRGLGNRPLADILFRDPMIHRRALQYACLDRRHALWRLAHESTGAADARLWARRSALTRGGHSLVVIEIFLPAVLALQARA